VASQTIHFGTSGWRGVIGSDFTFPGVRRAATAIAGYLSSRKKSPTVLVGYDTRFFSGEFARASAQILGAHGCRVLFCRAATPTPAIAYEILRRKLDGGLNITASHNPAEYNGLKFSGPDAGPALPEVTTEIEARAAALARDCFEANELADSNEFESVDLRDNYLARLAELVHFDTLRAAKLSFAYDALHGCGGGWLDKLLTDQGVAVTAIRVTRDVLFDGSGPDPSEENLAPLRKIVFEKKASAGLGTDGDADRFGILDSDGGFISPNHILGLLFDYLIQARGWKLGASRSVATSHLVDAVARLHGVPLYETPVGFKYVGEFIREDKIVIGGEESAGLTIRGHVPEKDGILACLLVAEMIATRRSSLAEQLRDLFGRVGSEYWPIRVNIHLSDDTQASLRKRLAEDVRQFAGRRVVKTVRIDGCKFFFDDGAWLLMRPSGTEPVVRIYAEAASLAKSRQLAEEARKWINQ
jgi:phosphoglucomutase